MHSTSLSHLVSFFARVLAAHVERHFERRRQKLCEEAELGVAAARLPDDTRRIQGAVALPLPPLLDDDCGTGARARVRQ
eukprot:3039277-Prymnesium_polylepis.1